MNRRFILAGAAALAASPAAFAQLPAAGTALDVRTGEQWLRGIAGPGQVTLAESRIALQKATNPMVKEFAGFEAAEATAVAAVLRDLGISVPAIDAATQGTISQLNAVPTGPGFDQAYITAMVENHEALEKLTEAYLKNAPAGGDVAERHTRHLAMLSLVTIKEHLTMTRRISDTIKG